MNWKSLIVVAVTSAVIAATTAWQIQSWRYQAVMADQTQRHALELAALQDTVNRINEEASRQLAVHQTQQQKQAAALASLDTQHYQELRRAQAENARLRADILAGDIRVSVSAVCPASDNAGAGDVSGDAIAASLDDGTLRAELHPAVAGRVVGIGGEADECARKLTALQAWVGGISAAKQAPPHRP